MKDIHGHKLFLGDKVAFNPSLVLGLRIGQVVRINKYRLLVKYGERISAIAGDQVAKKVLRVKV